MSGNPGNPGKKAGMRQARIHADPHWWQCMLECGKMVAEAKQFFITDDLEHLCRFRHPNASTHERRAIGPLMHELVRLGYCVATDDWVESRQKQCHARPMRVWWSLIYRGGSPRKRPRRPKPLDPRQLTLEIRPVFGKPKEIILLDGGE